MLVIGGKPAPARSTTPSNSTTSPPSTPSHMAGMPPSVNEVGSRGDAPPRFDEEVPSDRERGVHHEQSAGLDRHRVVGRRG
jgi:hypothetical protein